MRGKLGGLRVGVVQRRIIPARAGQTEQGRRQGKKSTDHPRACGANSSLRDEEPADTRIIPARAGQTVLFCPQFVHLPDHPRACGANADIGVSTWGMIGSSPRVRGKPVTLSVRASISRIIPARAGQTVRFYAITLERWTLKNWIRTVAPIFVLLFLLPVIGQNAYIERHYSNQSFSWFSKLHYASAFDLSLVA